ncbi:hypothetical protein M422DRAFT_259233 [Sphaerobolus stellatus SS14]|uniref:PAS domain-containing protein n=1 Tax=Sphaerobolus stellatus (strain SS14) TaxID=990650 RepID=A0A0C9VK47_SPHS4|nr:hypothetical protein M422DRAFT_259233 [Sphaerobolus stellatus SS14]
MNSEAGGCKQREWRKKRTQRFKKRCSFQGPFSRSDPSLSDTLAVVNLSDVSNNRFSSRSSSFTLCLHVIFISTVDYHCSSPPRPLAPQPALKIITRRCDAQSAQAAHCIELTLYLISLPEPRGAKMLYLSPSLTEVLSFEPSDVLGPSSFDWMHPDEVETVKQLHYNTIREDKATTVAYLRIKSQEDACLVCHHREHLSTLRPLLPLTPPQTIYTPSSNV